MCAPACFAAPSRRFDCAWADRRLALPSSWPSQTLFDTQSVAFSRLVLVRGHTPKPSDLLLKHSARECLECFVGAFVNEAVCLGPSASIRSPCFATRCSLCFCAGTADRCRGCTPLPPLPLTTRRGSVPPLGGASCPSPWQLDCCQLGQLQLDHCKPVFDRPVVSAQAFWFSGPAIGSRHFVLA